MASNTHKRARSLTTTIVAVIGLTLAPSTLAASSGGAGGTGRSAGGTGRSAGGTGGSTSSTSGTGGSAGGTSGSNNGSARGSTASSGATSVSGSGGASPTSKGTSAASKVARPHKTSVKVVASIASAHCVPSAKCSAKALEVSLRGGELQVSGKGIGPGMGVLFASRRNGKPLGPTSRYAPRAHLRKTSQGLIVTVPKLARSGRIAVVIGGATHTNLYGPVVITAKTLHPPVQVKTTPIGASPTGTAFDGQGMWIWYVSKSDGGNVASIVEQAKAAGVTTLYVKSSDGTNWWSQFSPELIAAAHAAGLKMCAWQYVYGTNPVGEAELGAKAAETGADCLVIDAESEYEGRYSQAQAYIQTLRAKVGPSYPIGLASFPYVNYHEAFPYSVFLGPEGAQFNAPQMYWKDIGTSVAQVYAVTYEQNLIYKRQIEPLGQTFENPSSSELVAFRSLAGAYGASGLSWWDWQETGASGWAALAAPLNSELTVPSPEATAPLLSQGATGDQVLWMQEHLASVYPTQPITGIFESTTVANLVAFQASKALPATGQTDSSTWGYLLELPPVAVNWSGGNPKA
ncbi:MAG: peptidoglycan-binding protein [Solirubrobacteraceae bacterium]